MKNQEAEAEAQRQEAARSPPALPPGLPRISPLPFGRGEGQGEGFVLSPQTGPWTKIDQPSPFKHLLINVTVPAFNEEKSLLPNVRKLAAFLEQLSGLEYEIVIAENGSTDATLEVAHSLAAENKNIRVVQTDEPGRGRALRTAWSSSAASILTYMDADLSNDLAAFPALIQALVGGKYDLATGSRLLSPELTTRCFKRELTSRAYNFLLLTLLRTRFSDAQCGFKAITRRAAQDLLPRIENTNWFFDTELLVLAERRGYRIFELPVRWTENRNTHVHILRTAAEDLQGILRLRSSLPK